MLRTLVVTWMEPLPLNAPTVNYTVLIGLVDGSPDNRTMFLTGPDELSFTVTDLLPFTNYSVSVLACSAAGCGDESLPVIQNTMEDSESTSSLGIQ